MIERGKLMQADLLLTPEQQKGMAEHIQYEIDEFRNSFQDLPGLRGQRHWNRTLESVLLHFRVLRAFFLDKGTHPGSDIHASDYVASWQPTRDPIFDSTKKAVDKVVAHLTLERLENPTLRNWRELDAMNTAVEVLIDQFRKSLSQEQAGWFPRLQASRPMPKIGAQGNTTISGPH